MLTSPTTFMVVTQEHRPGNSEFSDADNEMEVGHGYSGNESVVLALPSAQCFSFFRSHDEARLLRNRRSLVYDLEEYLPVDGDDLAIDRMDSKAGFLLIAADCRHITNALKEMEERGAYVSAISPLIFLALADLHREKPLRRVDVVLWQSEEGIDIVRLRQGTPVDWRWTENQIEAVMSALESIVPDLPSPKALLVDGAEGLVDALKGVSDLSQSSSRRNPSAAAECRRIVRGTATPWIDLRSGPLESPDPLRPIASPLRFLCVAAILLQLSVASALLLRGWQYRQQAESHVKSQEDVFQRVYPDEPIPVGIVSRLQSEHRRLSGTRGISNQNIPRLGSCVPAIHVFLSGLPDTSIARYTIDRLEFTPDRLALATGAAKSYGDLERVAEGLRKAGFAIPPVSATQSGGGVSLRLEDIGLIKGSNR